MAKRRVRYVLVTLFIAFLAAAALLLIVLPNRSRVESEQYAVISAYIEHGLTGESHDLGSKNGRIVILRRSTYSGLEAPQFRYLIGRAISAKRRFPSMSRKLLFSFFVGNLRSADFGRNFTLSAKYELATNEEAASYPNETFFKRFPNNYGLITFSRIGFNQNLTQAVFYTEHLCGLCGGGSFVVMRKVDGKWMVEGESYTWVS